MLNSIQARALHDQILAAYVDDSEESFPVFEELVEQATEKMNEHDFAALCRAIGREQPDNKQQPRRPQGRRTAIRLEVKWEDCWVGAYWKPRRKPSDIWICVLPCLPIHIHIQRRTK